MQDAWAAATWRTQGGRGTEGQQKLVQDASAARGAMDPRQDMASFAELHWIEPTQVATMVVVKNTNLSGVALMSVGRKLSTKLEIARATTTNNKAISNI